MGEFSNRVDAQRSLLRVVNSREWANEQLFALNLKAINRWALANGVDPSTPLVKLLNSASAEIFVMANHSEDPVSGSYAMSKQRVLSIATQLESILSGST